MIEELEFNGCHSLGQGFDKIFVHGSGPNLLLAAGCSWTRAWGAQDTALQFGDPEFQDNREFMLEHSFVGKLSRYLAIGTIINMALPGSSIDLQVRFLVEFLQKNRHRFDRIFVVWGITSHARWELYSNKVQKPSMFQVDATHMPPGKEKEMKFFLQYHWDEKFELERYSQKIVMLHSYLRMLDVDHLFFSTFESFNFNNMDLTNVRNRNFFMKDRVVNDMLSLWCVDNKIRYPTQIRSNPFSNEEISKLRDLTDLGYLSSKFAHPTAKAHQDIFSRLINHIEETQ